MAQTKETGNRPGPAPDACRTDRESGAPPAPGGLSRRTFLRGGAAGALGAGILGTLGGPEAADAAAQDATPGVAGPGPVDMSFRINGEAYVATIEPRVTLLDALRNHLDLTGAKKVCDRATCGACTVLVSGRPVYACSMLAIEAQGREITTIEGLGSPESMHPIQQAFVENDAQQCGFCTPGFVVACAALLQDNPNPDQDETHRALGGNLCRCGTYAGVRAAMAQVAGGGMSRA